MIYFIQAGDDGLIKIGYTADVDQSIQTWQEGSPIPLNPLATIEGGLEAEVYLHSKFSRLKQHGKWFKVSKEIFDFIENPILPLGLLADKPSLNDKKRLGKLNQLLLKIKYQNRVGVEWQDIAREVGMSTDRLHKLRHEGFYGGLRWEQIQRLAKLINMSAWELVRLVEEGCLPGETDNDD
jgi:hypothetical protein